MIRSFDRLEVVYHESPRLTGRGLFFVNGMNLYAACQHFLWRAKRPDDLARHAAAAKMHDRREAWKMVEPIDLLGTLVEK